MGQTKFYTDDHLKIVQDNLMELGYVKVAELVGVSHHAIKKQISVWRKLGHKIPFLRKMAVGETRIRTRDGITYVFKKVEEKVRCKPIERLTPIKERAYSAQKNKVQPKQKIMSIRHPKKPEVKKMPDRVVDFSEKKSVLVDKRFKTTVLVDKSVSDEDAIAAWKKKHPEAFSFTV